MEPSGADAVPAPKSMPAQSHLTPSGADALPVPMRASLRPAALKQAQRRRERNARRAASWRESRAEMPFLPLGPPLLETPPTPVARGPKGFDGAVVGRYQPEPPPPQRPPPQVTDDDHGREPSTPLAEDPGPEEARDDARVPVWDPDDGSHDGPDVADAGAPTHAESKGNARALPPALDTGAMGTAHVQPTTLDTEAAANAHAPPTVVDADAADRAHAPRAAAATQGADGGERRAARRRWRGQQWRRRSSSREQQSQ